MTRPVFFLCTFLLSLPLLFGQTIAEKKAGITRGGAEFDPNTQKLLKDVNSELKAQRARLRDLYAKAQVLFDEGATFEQFAELLAQINNKRQEIASIEETWREAISHIEKGEGYALWHQPATTLEQIIIDYGSVDYVYIMPPEIAAMKLSVSSSIPIPRALWGEMVELLLTQEGVGIRQLNPYLRQLYLLSKNPSGVRTITNDRQELEFLPKEARVAFVISPDPSEVRRVGIFLEKFINPSTTAFEVIGRDIVIVASVSEIQELLKLYDFAARSRFDKEYKLIPLTKVNTEEMAKVLESMFEQFEKVKEVDGTEKAGKVKTAETYGLKVIPLKQVAHAVFLVGTRKEIQKAELIIQEVENQVGNVRSKVIYTYRTRHSDPDELGNVLQRIYDLLVQEQVTATPVPSIVNTQVAAMPPGVRDVQNPTVVNHLESSPPNNDQQNVTVVSPTRNIFRAPFPTTVDDTPGFYQSGGVIINPAPVQLELPQEKFYNEGRDNFLVDPKTGLLVMVVDPALLPRLKELIRRMDVPKKMVQLDVLHFEKSNRHTNNFGLNLFRIGGGASNQRFNSIEWNDVNGGNPCAPAADQCLLNKGVLEFFASTVRGHGIPAYDISYRFLMSQEDITINANPSVVTLNQTPAFIAIVQEISISTGIVEVQAAGGIQAKDAFTRAQFGTQITITPTIHAREPEDREWWDDTPDYVTLETDVHFDTLIPSIDNRPTSVRRAIKNQVRVVDGETVILGGLRQKNMNDAVDKVPFLGEIPGLGKLFSSTSLRDDSTEMFIFITPTIINDPCADFERVRREQLMRRPGDIPYFLCALDRARVCEKERLFAQGLTMVFGRPLERCLPWGDDACLQKRHHSHPHHLPNAPSAHQPPSRSNGNYW